MEGKTLHLEQCIPVALVSGGAILARDGAVTIGWELYPPEEYSVTQEQYDAMTCRCFAGKYRRFRAPFRAADLLALALCLLLIALFVYLEYAIRCSN